MGLSKASRLFLTMICRSWRGWNSGHWHHLQVKNRGISIHAHNKRRSTVESLQSCSCGNSRMWYELHKTNHGRRPDELEVTGVIDMRSITNMTLYKTVKDDYVRELVRNFETTAGRPITVLAFQSGGLHNLRAASEYRPDCRCWSLPSYWPVRPCLHFTSRCWWRPLRGPEAAFIDVGIG